MPVDRDALDALHRQMLDRLSTLTTGPEWLAWLETSRQFHRYSPQNQLLLAAQGAQGLVASYRTWQRIPAQDGNRCQVRRGETGLKILAPLTVTGHDTDPATGDDVTVVRGVKGFKTVTVFHQGQLVSPPAVEPPALPGMLTGENRWQHVWAAVDQHLDHLGYQLEIVTRPIGATWNGRTDFTSHHVAIGDHLEPPHRLKTLLHEWAHIALGHDQLPGRNADRCEVEAESVAYLVANTLGLDSAIYSIPYVAGWSGGDLELVATTAQRVLHTASEIIHTLEQRLDIDLAADPLVASVAIGEHSQSGLRSADGGEPSSRHPSGGHAREPLPVADEPTTPIASLPRARPRSPVVAAARQVVQQLSDRSMARLLHALTDIDRNIDAAAGLCADAGLTPADTITLLGAYGADPERLTPAVVAVDAQPSPAIAELLANLDGADLATFMSTLPTLATSIDIASGLCAQAGLDPDTTLALFAELGASENQTVASMTRAVRDDHQSALSAADAGGQDQTQSQVCSADTIVDRWRLPAPAGLTRARWEQGERAQRQVADPALPRQ